MCERLQKEQNTLPLIVQFCKFSNSARNFIPSLTKVYVHSQRLGVKHRNLKLKNEITTGRQSLKNVRCIFLVVYAVAIMMVYFMNCRIWN